MLLSDKGINDLVDSGAIEGGRASSVGPVSYDLGTLCFYTRGGKADHAELMPGESVFVGSEEVLHVPSGLAARVLLKNSRIRQGLALDAPLYFPGHSTRVFFRVTNVSADAVALDCSRPIAQVAFETVQEGTTYDGAFAGEFDFRGLASYSDVLGPQMRELDAKRDEVAGIERRMYGNVLALFAVFAAIFTLVNVSASSLSTECSPAWLVTVDLMVIGGFSLLASAIERIVVRDGRATKALVVIGGACVAASVVLALIVR